MLSYLFSYLGCQLCHLPWLKVIFQCVKLILRTCKTTFVFMSRIKTHYLDPRLSRVNLCYRVWVCSDFPNVEGYILVFWPFPGGVQVLACRVRRRGVSWEVMLSTCVCHTGHRNGYHDRYLLTSHQSHNDMGMGEINKLTDFIFDLNNKLWASKKASSFLILNEYVKKK